MLEGVLGHLAPDDDAMRAAAAAATAALDKEVASIGVISLAATAKNTKTAKRAEVDRHLTVRNPLPHARSHMQKEAEVDRRSAEANPLLSSEPHAPAVHVLHGSSSGRRRWIPVNNAGGANGSTPDVVCPCKTAVMPCFVWRRAAAAGFGFGLCMLYVPLVLQLSSGGARKAGRQCRAGCCLRCPEMMVVCLWGSGRGQGRLGAAKTRRRPVEQGGRQMSWHDRCLLSCVGQGQRAGEAEEQQGRGPAILSSGTLRLDVRPLAQAALAGLASGNQKLGLLAALMRVGHPQQQQQQQAQLENNCMAAVRPCMYKCSSLWCLSLRAPAWQLHVATRTTCKQAWWNGFVTLNSGPSMHETSEQHPAVTVLSTRLDRSAPARASMHHPWGCTLSPCVP